jgi:hypothetical protein
MVVAPPPPSQIPSTITVEKFPHRMKFAAFVTLSGYPGVRCVSLVVLNEKNVWIAYTDEPFEFPNGEVTISIETKVVMFDEPGKYEIKPFVDGKEHAGIPFELIPCEAP